MPTLIQVSILFCGIGFALGFIGADIIQGNTDQLSLLSFLILIPFLSLYLGIILRQFFKVEIREQLSFLKKATIFSMLFSFTVGISVGWYISFS